MKNEILTEQASHTEQSDDNQKAPSESKILNAFRNLQMARRAQTIETFNTQENN